MQQQSRMEEQKQLQAFEKAVASRVIDTTAASAITSSDETITTTNNNNDKDNKKKSAASATVAIEIVVSVFERSIRKLQIASLIYDIHMLMANSFFIIIVLWLKLEEEKENNKEAQRCRKK